MGAPSLQRFRLEQSFFGLKPEDRPILHDQLFDLLWIGEGRWDFNTIYHMPIFLRNFWVKKLNDMTNKKLNQQQQANNKKSTKDKIAKPPM